MTAIGTRHRGAPPRTHVGQMRSYDQPTRPRGDDQRDHAEHPRPSQAVVVHGPEGARDREHPETEGERDRHRQAECVGVPYVAEQHDGRQEREEQHRQRRLVEEHGLADDVERVVSREPARHQDELAAHDTEAVDEVMAKPGWRISEVVEDLREVPRRMRELIDDRRQPHHHDDADGDEPRSHDVTHRRPVAARVASSPVGAGSEPERPRRG